MPIAPVPTDKLDLLVRGGERIEQFCQANGLPVPEVTVVPKEDWYVGFCAYYREDLGIRICLEHCGWPCGIANSRNWTWPGSTTDREPYGVLCHELGHHVDLHQSMKLELKSGAYYGGYSVRIMEESGEEPISGYCPNPWEWFAEMFRLFCTNHALLKMLRPKTHRLLCRDWKPVSSDNWLVELGGNVPDRVVRALRNKMKVKV